MSVFITPYHTTVGKNYSTSKTTHAIAKCIVTYEDAQYIQGQDEPYIKFITGRFPSEAEVPSFVHPLEVVGPDNKKFLCIDVRPFVYVEPRDMSYIVRNKSEFNLAKARLIATKSLIVNTPQSISGLSTLPCSVFSSWISESISHRFSLDPLDQLRLAIICSFYYQSLFENKSTFDSSEIERINSVCIKTTRAPAKIVYQTTALIGKLENITDFCSNVKDILENSRLSEFNAGFLITVLKNSWFGANSAEILAVSLEHTPTWVSLIYAAMSERTYRNSTISKICERYSKDNSFIRAFVQLIQDVEGVQSKDD